MPSANAQCHNAGDLFLPAYYKVSMRIFRYIGCLVVLLQSMLVHAQAQEHDPLNISALTHVPESVLSEFKQLHTNVMLQGLRHPGNAPYILSHPQPTAKLVVLLHGLSDSPFYLRSIATHLHQQGHTVVVGLLPGHGVDDPLPVLHNNELAQIWRDYLSQLIRVTRGLGSKLYVGGFSTGGTLATDYMLDHLADVDGLLLFSGALRLADNAETLSKIPFAKWVSKIIDGEYVTASKNPYKYPDVSNHAALVLMDIIRSIRQRLVDSTGVVIPIFAAHSHADQVTPITGIYELLNVTVGQNTFFAIDDSLNVCHANLPLDAQQVATIGIDDYNPLSNCDALAANPVHQHMLSMAASFVAQ